MSELNIQVSFENYTVPTECAPKEMELRLAWVEALGSGKYLQCYNRLREPYPMPFYCCLGVLCEISSTGWWENYKDNKEDITKTRYTETVNEGQNQYLPGFVAKSIGIPKSIFDGESLELTFPGRKLNPCLSSIACLNDNMLEVDPESTTVTYNPNLAPRNHQYRFTFKEIAIIMRALFVDRLPHADVTLQSQDYLRSLNQQTNGYKHVAEA